MKITQNCQISQGIAADFCNIINLQWYLVNKADCANFCGLLRKAELYKILIGHCPLVAHNAQSSEL